MTRANPLLTRRAVVRAKVEADYGIAETFGPEDGVLVSEPEYEIDPTVLERDIVTNDLSPQPIIMGRKLATMRFTAEFRGNGKHKLADVAQSPALARLFRGCGYSLVAVQSPEIKGVYDVDDHVNEVEWAVTSGSAATGTLTATDQPADTETVVIGGRTYTFQTALTNVAGNVLIGANLTASLANLRHAINGTGVPGTNYAVATTPHPQVTAQSTGTTLTVTAGIGDGGNAIATTDTYTDASWGAGTLTGGDNSHDATDVVAYYLRVTTGGASGVAQITVTSDTAGQGNAAAAVSTGVGFTVGSLGVEITPTFAGDLEVGQEWVLWALPTGLRMDPVSDDFDSLTIDMNRDGVLHTMPGSFGTFDIEAEAGDYGRVNFEFTGIYVAPVDASLADPDYERTLPAQVELARLRLHSFNAIVANFTYDQQNEINIRPDVNSEEGYIGTRITARNPEGGIDPEAERVADYDFWEMMSTAKRMPFQMRVGSVAGNTIWCFSPSVQYTGLTYQDRDGILSYDAGLRFSRYDGNDEMTFFFC